MHIGVRTWILFTYMLNLQRISRSPWTETKRDSQKAWHIESLKFYTILQNIILQHIKFKFRTSSMQLPKGEKDWPVNQHEAVLRGAWWMWGALRLRLNTQRFIIPVRHCDSPIMNPLADSGVHRLCRDTCRCCLVFFFLLHFFLRPLSALVALLKTVPWTATKKKKTTFIISFEKLPPPPPQDLEIWKLLSDCLETSVFFRKYQRNMMNDKNIIVIKIMKCHH